MSGKNPIEKLWPCLSPSQKASMCIYSNKPINDPTCAHCGFQGNKEKHFGVIVHIIPTKNNKFSASVKNSAWLCLKCFGLIPENELISERKEEKHFPIMFSYKSRTLDANGQTTFKDFYFTEETIAKFFPEILQRIKIHQP